MYEWAGYQNVLVNHYKGKTTKEEFARSLGNAVAKAEGEGTVPPGLHAEYGYALLDVGQEAEAVVQFEQEAALWPEARPFLTGLISRIDAQPAPTQGAVEATGDDSDDTADMNSR